MDGFDLYDHDDYRAALRAWLDARAGRPSLRTFAGRAGCSHPLVVAILGGKRALDLDRVEAFTTALELEADEARYFRDLVLAEAAPDEEARSHARARATATRRFQLAGRVGRRMVAVFSAWYVPVLLEIAAQPGFDPDPRTLGSRLLPPVDPEAVAAALELLVETGCLVREPGGRLTPRRNWWVTEHEIADPTLSAAICHNDQWLLRRGADALQTLPSSQRHVTTAILGVPPSLLPEVKRRLGAFQLELMSLCESAPPGPAAIHAITLQLLPLTTPP